MFNNALVLLLGACWGVQAALWPRGVVHYAINTLDYDINSQEVIISALADLEKETCLKFFYKPLNYTASDSGHRLYISNPDRRKPCPPDLYDYSKDVVMMPIGYKCINKRDIARIAMDMLRASVESPVESPSQLNEERQKPASRTVRLLPREDRQFLQQNYAAECRKMALVAGGRRAGGEGADDSAPDYTRENEAYYSNKVWPFGIIMYAIDRQYGPSSAPYQRLKRAMAAVELTTCLVFQDVSGAGTAVLAPNNLLTFAGAGADMPHFGFREGNQTVNIESMVNGAVAHQSHTLSQLLRAAGLPMESNRHDRDRHLKVVWQNIERGKEHLFEKEPASATPPLPYDFRSATHAPVNWQCGGACATGERTLVPLQDHLWHRTLTLGHHHELSAGDVRRVGLVYERECRTRYAGRPIV